MALSLHPLGALENVPTNVLNAFARFFSAYSQEAGYGVIGSGAGESKRLPTKSNPKRKWADSSKEFREGRGYTNPPQKTVQEKRPRVGVDQEALRAAIKRAGVNQRRIDEGGWFTKIVQGKRTRVYVAPKSATVTGGYTQNTDRFTDYRSRYSRKTWRMPKRRVFRGSRRTYKRRYGMKRMGYRKKGYGAANGLWNARFGKGVEVKFLDTTMTGTAGAGQPITDVPVVQLLNGITQDTSFSGRIGNSVKFVSMNWRLNLMNTNESTNTHRFIILIDKQPNGALPAIGNILSNATTNETAVISPLNLNFRKRFVVCRDKIIVTDSAQKVSTYWKGKCRFAFRTQYTTAGNGIADISSYSILLVYVSEFGSTLGANDQWNMIIRVRYTDD